jgi:hypothetical protein
MVAPRILVAVLTAAICWSTVPAAHGQLTKDRATSAAEARFVTEDVENFLDAYARLDAGSDSVAVLNRYYLERASPGLSMFIEKYDLTARRLARAIGRYPETYDRLPSTLRAVESKEPSYRESYARMKEVIPDAEFPPTYFLVGAHRGIGSGSAEGPLITIEKSSEQSLRDDPNALLVHEMVHLQQVRLIGLDKYLAIYGPEKSLLAMTLREGIAEYFTDRITGTMTQEEALSYTLEHERSLWNRFQEEMHGAETGNWMWTTPSDPDQPPHVAYVLGAKIVETFFESASDKNGAVREILSVTDYPDFVERSRYEHRFSAR